MNGKDVIAANVGKAFITDALLQLIQPVIAGASVAAVPLAAEVIAVGTASFLYQKIFGPYLAEQLSDSFGLASTKIEIMNGNGTIGGGVIYSNGLPGSDINAAMDLLSWSLVNAANKPGVNSHLQFYTTSLNKEGVGYDVLASDVLTQISQDLGVSASAIENGDGHDVGGSTKRNADLLASYLLPEPNPASARYNILQTGAQLGLHMYDRLSGADLWFAKNAMSFGGSLAGLKLDSINLAAFGTSGSDNLDFGAASGKVYAYGGSGVDTIRGGSGDDVLWGDVGGNITDGTKDYIYGGLGKDQIFGDGGDDQLFGEGGNDYIDGGSGADVIDGGSDDDEIWGGLGGDTIHGGSDNDFLEGGSTRTAHTEEIDDCNQHSSIKCLVYSICDPLDEWLTGIDACIDEHV